MGVCVRPLPFHPIYEAQGKYTQAEPLRDKELQVQRRVAGNASQRALPPALSLSLAALGGNLLRQQKFAQAEPLLRECLKNYDQTQPNDWMRYRAQYLLGWSLAGQTKYADAEPLLLSGYEGMKQREDKIPAQGKVHLAEAVERLIELYTASNKPDEVKKWQAERAKYSEVAPVSRET